jgi:predicted alpha-1,2-mannosidase
MRAVRRTGSPHTGAGAGGRVTATLATAVVLVVVLSGCGPAPAGPTPPAGATSAPGGSTPAEGTPSPASPSSYVDPFMGTGVGGSSVGAIDTFPGADTPFGMVQWSPDTSPDRASGGGYTYADSAISGFSLTHLSGPGCPFYGDIPILPTVGAIGADPGAATAPFSHATEVAHPGSYAVTVGRRPVHVELAVTTRAGLGRFGFPGSGPADLLFKVADSAAGSAGSEVSIVGDQEVDGSVVSGALCGTSGLYHLYFAARFDTPFTGFGTWHGTRVEPRSRTSSAAKSGGYVTFGASVRVVQMQVGVSFVSVAGARANIDAEQPGWDLGALEQRDTATWDALLGRMAVSGGSVADERTFYSALYKSLLHPNVFDDADGAYPGFDGRAHVATGYTQYSDFSEWDIYRDVVPLQAVLAPHQASDMITSLLADAAQGGALPKWVAAGSDAAQQNGDSADPIIASAYAFGARGFDVPGALADMVRGATDPATSNGTYPERQDLAEYLAKGYVDAGRHDLTSLDYTVGGSETLEYALDDFAVSQLARAAGDAATYATFIARAQNWRNLVDPATGYLAARRADGTFPPGPAFQPSPQADVGQVGFEEGNAVQYTWSVPQNLRGLFDALGGDAAVVAKLNTFFTKLNTSRKQPYDWAGNEPSLGIPWEYDYAGAPWRTQSVVRRIATTLYSATPDGEPGNDDLGAMASWFVWAAVGLYPEVPGRGELVVASPLFPHVTVSLADGRSIVIDAPGASPGTPYVHGLDVQGLSTAPGTCPGAVAGPAPTPYDCPWLPASATTTGATLDFTLGSAPDAAWGAAPAAAPPSFPGG